MIGGMLHVDLIVDSRLRVRSERPLAEEVRRALMKLFTHRNPVHAKAKKQLENLPRKADGKIRGILHGRLKAEPEWIATWKTNDGELSLPRGGIVEARELLEDAGCDVDSVDERCEGDQSLLHSYEHKLKARDYQVKVCDAIAEWEQGLVRSPTGSGKTSAMIRAAVESGLPSLFVVHTNALLEQWVERLEVELDLGRDEIGIYGDGKKRVRSITVGTQQTLAGHVEEIHKTFGFLGCDEVHLFAANTFSKFVDRMPCRYRIGVSDDVKRKDRKEFLLYDLFGEQIARVKREELVAREFIFDVEVRLFRTEFDPGWWRELGEQERPHHWGRLIEAMTENDARNGCIVDLVRREVKAGEIVLTWADRVEHCTRMHAMFCAWDARAGLLLGGKDRQKEFYETILGIKAGATRAAFGTYKAVGPSIDLPMLTRGVTATPIHNNPGFVNQVRGRICRRPDGKESAILYVPWDEHVFGEGVVEKYCRIAKVVKLLEPGGEWVDGHAWVKARRAERAEAARAAEAG